MADNNIVEKKVEKVIEGEAKLHKKTLAQKAASFIFEEDIKDVKQFVINEIVKPSVKKLIADIFHNGVDMSMFGTPYGQRPGQNSKASKVSYVSYSSFAKPQGQQQYAYQRQTGRSYDDVSVPTLSEAKTIADRMVELLETYQMASVADYYELCGVNSEFTDCNYGWTDLHDMEIVRDRDGSYIIKMPKAVVIR